MTQDRKAPAAGAGGKSSSRRAPAADLTTRARSLTGSCLARASRNLARRTTQIYDRHLAPHDFSLPQFAMLMMIAAAKDDTLGALAIDAGLDPSTLTRNLQGLEKLELVEIASIGEDQRRRSVWLTETGARRVSAAIPAWEAAQAEIVKTLGARFTGELMKASAVL